MDSSLISKVEKAIRYAQEKDRIRFSEFKVQLNGDNELHTITFNNGKWSCTCWYFPSHAVCSHTMAMERVLSGMLPESPKPAVTINPSLSQQPA